VTRASPVVLYCECNDVDGDTDSDAADGVVASLHSHRDESVCEHDVEMQFL
jgi:hypothetical protein